MVNHRAPSRFLPTLMCVVLSALLTACQPTVDELVQRAETLAEAGNYRASVIELKNALRQDSENARARLLLARSTAQLGDYPTAISEYERVLGLGDTREIVWIEFGRALLRQGRATEVLDRVLPNLSEASPSIDIAILRGNAIAALGNMEEARAAYEGALDLDSAEVEALVGLAVIASGEGNESKASELIERAIELNPDSEFAWRAKGNYLRIRGELEAAAGAYAKSISLETPRTPLADQFSSRVNRADILLDTGKTDEAEAEIQELEKLLPQHPLLRFLRGRLAYDRGEFDAAQQHFQEYLSQVPEDFRAHAMLGAVNFSQNHLRQAEAYLSQAASRNVGGDMTRRLLAETQLRLNKPDEAMQSLGSFETSSSDDPIMLMMLGRAQLGLGNTESALNYLRQSVRNAPENSAAQLSLAAVLIASKKYDEALSVLEAMPKLEDPEFTFEKILMALHVKRADNESAIAVAEKLLRENPNDSKAFSVSGNLHEILGDTIRARVLFEKAVDLDPGNLGALYGLGDLALKDGDKAGAERWFSSALDLDAGFIPALVRLTQLFVADDRFGELQGHLAAAIEKDESVLAPHILRARAAIATERYAEALRFIQESRLSVADSPLLDHAEGLSLVNSGQVEAGLRKLALAADAAPETSVFQLDLARYRLRHGDFKGAEDAIARYRELEPTSVVGLGIDVEARARDGRPEEARRELATFRAANGDSVGLNVFAGDIEMYTGNPEVAEAHYAAAAGQLWARPIVLRLITAAVQSAHFDRAFAVIQRWLNDNPDDLQMIRLHAQILEASGDVAAAVQQYERALEAGAEDAIALNNLAWRYMEEGRSGAVQLAERAHELEPDNGSITDTLGWILFQQGDFDRAEQMLRTATRQAPNNPEIKYHLATLLSETGQNSEAKSILTRLLEENGSFNNRDKAEELANSL